MLRATIQRRARRLARFLPLCLLLCATLPAAALPREVRVLKAVYDEQITRIRGQQAADVKSAKSDYIAGLGELEKKFLSAGDLKPLLAVRKEKQSVSGGAAFGESGTATGPAALEGLQKSYTQACKDARMACAESIVELSQRYRARLASLQKDLTRQDRIEDALVVLTETEEIPNYPEVHQAQKQIAAGGTLEDSAGVSAAAAHTAREIDTAALAAYFHAEINGWNSITHQLTCTFDFRSEDQLAAWEGAGFDALRSRMICGRRTAWLKPTFASISRITFDGYHHEGTGPLRCAVGKNLVCDVEPGADGKALLHQGNAFFPLHQSQGGAQPYVKYPSTIMLAGGRVEWTSGRRSFPAQKVQKPLGTPLAVGFGHAEASAMFDNVTVTGVLSPATMRAVARGGE